MAKYGEAPMPREERLRKSHSARNAEDELAKDLAGSNASSGEYPVVRPPIDEHPAVAAAKERALEKDEVRKKSGEHEPVMPSRPARPAIERPTKTPEQLAKDAEIAAETAFRLRIDAMTVDAAQNIIAEVERQSANEVAAGKPGAVTTLLERTNAATAGLDIPKIKAATILLSIPRPAARAIMDKLGIGK